MGILCKRTCTGKGVATHIRAVGMTGPQCGYTSESQPVGHGAVLVAEPLGSRAQSGQSGPGIQRIQPSTQNVQRFTNRSDTKTQTHPRRTANLVALLGLLEFYKVNEPSSSCFQPIQNIHCRVLSAARLCPVVRIVHHHVETIKTQTFEFLSS